MKKTDILVACGDRPRHLYFAARIAQRFSDCAIITESKSGDAEAQPEKIKKHFLKFEKTEKEFFSGFLRKHEKLLSKKIVARLKKGEINSSETLELIKKINPKFILVYSTSIIKPDLISAFPRRWINLHAGLSPYYRGGGTNVYPFLNKELEYVGMTVHYLEKGIDDGEIILQGRPEFEANDNTHTIGRKTVVLGADLVIKAAEGFLQNKKMPSVKQDKSIGRLYLKKDFTEETVEKINALIKSGLVREYAKNPKKVDIVEW